MSPNPTSYLAFVPAHTPSRHRVLAIVDRGHGAEADAVATFPDAFSAAALAAALNGILQQQVTAERHLESVLQGVPDAVRAAVRVLLPALAAAREDPMALRVAQHHVATLIPSVSAMGSSSRSMPRFSRCDLAQSAGQHRCERAGHPGDCSGLSWIRCRIGRRPSANNASSSSSLSGNDNSLSSSLAAALVASHSAFNVGSSRSALAVRLTIRSRASAPGLSTTRSWRASCVTV
jgi:hypothetical protein